MNSNSHTVLCFGDNRVKKPTKQEYDVKHQAILRTMSAAANTSNTNLGTNTTQPICAETPTRQSPNLTKTGGCDCPVYGYRRSDKTVKRMQRHSNKRKDTASNCPCQTCKGKRHRRSSSADEKATNNLKDDATDNLKDDTTDNLKDDATDKANEDININLESFFQYYWGVGGCWIWNPVCP